jgi:D-2-hydroxyacid dehydrogenase (NADP+)
MEISVWLTNREVQCLNFTERQKAALERNLGNARVSLHADSASFKAGLPKADIAAVWVFKDEWLALAPRLKWIATPAAGKDYFDIHPPARIKVSYGAFHGVIMAETALGLMLSAARGILKARELQNKHEWPRTELEKSMTTLAGSHVVILGFGSIGRHIARLAKPFGARITGVKRTPAGPPEFFGKEDEIITMDRLDSVLPETDHLMIVLPQDRSTDNILDKRRLALLPRRARVYNIGRGNSINEADLAEALTSGKISGAYLDVFQEEPLKSDSPLRRCPNLLILPHASALAPNYMDLFVEEFAARYREWIKTNG